MSSQTKPTASSSFSSICNARNSRNTTVGSSAFSLAKESDVFFNLLGTEQSLERESSSLNHNLGCMCLRHYRGMRPSPYPAQTAKRTSRLSSLRCDLTDHGQTCIHPVLQPTGLCSSAAQLQGASRPTGPARLGAVGPAGT